MRFDVTLELRRYGRIHANIVEAAADDATARCAQHGAQRVHVPVGQVHRCFNEGSIERGARGETENAGAKASGDRKVSFACGSR
jgi:hypothetical protein